MKTGSAEPSMCSPPLHLAEVGGSPRLMLFPCIFRGSSADAAEVYLFSMFSNRTFHVLCHLAEVGESPRLKLLPHILKSSSTDYID